MAELIGGATATLTIGGVALSDRMTAASLDIEYDSVTTTAFGDSVETLIGGVETILRMAPGSLSAGPPIEVDDRFVGEGYGISTPASREAIDLLARRDAVLLDPTYTAKAMAALIAYLRAGRFRDDATVLFWHTGGQVNLFA